MIVARPIITALAADFENIPTAGDGTGRELTRRDARGSEGEGCFKFTANWYSLEGVRRPSQARPGQEVCPDPDVFRIPFDHIRCPDPCTELTLST